MQLFGCSSRAHWTTQFSRFSCGKGVQRSHTAYIAEFIVYRIVDIKSQGKYIAQAENPMELHSAVALFRGTTLNAVCLSRALCCEHTLFASEMCYTRKSFIWILIRVAGSYLLAKNKFELFYGFLHRRRTKQAISSILFGVFSIFGHLYFMCAPHFQDTSETTHTHSLTRCERHWICGVFCLCIVNCNRIRKQTIRQNWMDGYFWLLSGGEKERERARRLWSSFVRIVVRGLAVCLCLSVPCLRLRCFYP